MPMARRSSGRGGGGPGVEVMMVMELAAAEDNVIIINRPDQAGLGCNLYINISSSTFASPAPLPSTALPHLGSLSPGQPTRVSFRPQRNNLVANIIRSPFASRPEQTNNCKGFNLMCCTTRASVVFRSVAGAAPACICIREGGCE
ncbi:uncharacterized protein LOC125537422 isoform X1 [Triticum urartu]|uniref:uncharacterized protein LOC125537422 isoform X1 n=2 Tax=Triticum urartu TaxID=4572 RepID=UPI0020431457|nr:uncharacterized protein LOC125537422 isoform X1 [Triticum urartu]